jgi:hypothetical protein
MAHIGRRKPRLTVLGDRPDLSELFIGENLDFVHVASFDV